MAGLGCTSPPSVVACVQSDRPPAPATALGFCPRNGLCAQAPHLPPAAGAGSTLARNRFPGATRLGRGAAVWACGAGICLLAPRVLAAACAKELPPVPAARLGPRRVLPARAARALPPLGPGTSTVCWGSLSRVAALVLGAHRGTLPPLQDASPRAAQDGGAGCQGRGACCDLRRRRGAFERSGGSSRGSSGPRTGGVCALVSPALLTPSLPPSRLRLGSLVLNCVLDGAGRSEAHPRAEFTVPPLCAGRGPLPPGPPPTPMQPPQRLCRGLPGSGAHAPLPAGP